eukprot:536889-Karenia_brevis.AAC.1
MFGADIGQRKTLLKPKLNDSCLAMHLIGSTQVDWSQVFLQVQINSQCTHINCGVTTVPMHKAVAASPTPAQLE